MDADGWQISQVSVQDSSFEAASASSEGWQLAESKRSKRKKDRQQKIEAYEAAAPDDQLKDTVHSDAGFGTADGAASGSRNGAHRPVNSSSTHRKGVPQSTPTSKFETDTFFSELTLQESTSTNKSEKKRRRKRAKLQPSETSQSGISNGSGSQYRLFAHFSEGVPTHRDERQVELDIKRSFVEYKTGPLADEHKKQRRRQQLQDIVVGVLRRHPLLNYYQGYHDVVSVLILVLCPQTPSNSRVWADEDEFSLVLSAAERLSLFYLRDFMAPGIDPCIGWLKIIRNAVRRFDPTYASEIVERAGPLPFFALSWLITLLSHDLSLESETVRRVFDRVLEEGPSTIIWILAALLWEAKGDLRLGAVHRAITQDGDESDDEDPNFLMDDPDLLHHSLSKLPKRLAQLEEVESMGETSSSRRSADVLFATAQRIQNACSSHQRSDSYSSQEKTQEPREIVVLWQSIMGPRSVLSTWTPLNGGATENTWKARETEAEGCLAFDANGRRLSMEDKESFATTSGGEGIVVNPYPTPPPSESGDDVGGIYGGEPKEPRRSKGSKDLPRSALEAVGTALFVGVFVVAGAAVVLSTARNGVSADSSMLRHQIKVVQDLGHLGSDFLRLALTAGR